MTMTNTETPAAWVGCLGCYNEGILEGKWLTDPDEIREYKCPRPKTIYNLHEELWVMDHENMPLITGECSPSTFADAIEWLEQFGDANTWIRPVGAVVAWLNNLGLKWQDADLDEFDEAYWGEWTSEEDFTANLYEDTADSPEECQRIRNGEGLYAYIDWGRVSRDLFMCDCWSAEAPGGVYVFRNT